MSETGVLIFIGCIIGVAVLGALIAVIAFGSIKSKIKIKYRFINL